MNMQMQRCYHQRCIRWVFTIGIVLCCLASEATAQSFDSQFSSPIFYGLAIAGISLAAAVGAALFGLLIFCLIRRRRNEDRKLSRSDTEASTTLSSQQQQQQQNNQQQQQQQQQKKQQQQQQQQQQDQKLRTVGLGIGGGGGGNAGFGPMALPVAASAATPARGGGSGGSGGGNSATRTQYANQGFDGRDSSVVSGGSGGGGGGGPSAGAGGGLFRHSSFLRPISYASLESNHSRNGQLAGTSNNGAPHNPVVTHAAVRTSPASTLDPSYFLSQGGIANLGRQQQHHQASNQLLSQQDQKRLSYAERSSQQQLQQHHYQQDQQNQKRLSYAEQRAVKIGDGGSGGVELVSGQVFASNGGLQQHPTRHLSHAPSLTTQPEEAASRKSRQAPRPPPTSSAASLTSFSLEAGPSFPRSRTRPTAAAASTSDDQPTSDVGGGVDGVQKRQQSLHRIQLGGGEDNRSVTSTVLKQEALKAFEFLDGLED